MAKLLLNADGKVLMKDDKVYKAPEGENPLQTLITGRGANAGKGLFQDYQGDNVDFIKDLDFSANEDCEYMFYRASNLTTIPDFNKSNAKTLYNSFGYCSNLETISLSNTSNVENLNSTFYICLKLKTIFISNTSKVTTMYQMCYECQELEYISPLDTSECKNFQNTFRNCRKLKTVDFTSWDACTTTNMTFIDCKSLTKVIIRTMTVIPPLSTTTFTRAYHFTGEVEATYNPDGLKDGRIYVPDEWVEQLKSATNWSAYADIIVPLSTLEE